MKKILVIFLLVLISSIVFAAEGDLDKSYVSLNGKFYINYPSDWQQVPYIDVDRYLASKKAGRSLYNFEAVLAPQASNPFFSGTYLFLTIDTVGNLSNKQIDSVLNDLKSTFGEDIKYYPVSNFMADLKSNAPNYDKDSKVITIYNKIVKNESTVKSSLIMMKFYETGIANFYFYSPESEFEKKKSLFNKIVQSFNTKDIKAQLPKENLKVADIDRAKDKSNDSSDDNGSNIALWITFGIILLYVIIRRKREKNS